MNKETIEQIKIELAPLAEKLGQGAEFTWEVVLKQQYVEATIGLLTALIVLGIFIFLMIPWAKELLNDSFNEIGWLPFSCVLLVLIPALYIGLLVGITHFINPEYYALQDILNMVK